VEFVLLVILAQQDANIKNRQYIYSPIEDSEVVPVFERNNAGLKKLSQVLSEQTSDSSAFLNATCLVRYDHNCKEHFSFLIFRFGLTVTGFARLYCNWIDLQAVPISTGQITGATFEGT
jgi:hypothetical protein